jgi:hypothetical protein
MSWIAAIRSTRRPKCDQDPQKKLPPSGRPRPRSRGREGAAAVSALLASSRACLLRRIDANSAFNKPGERRFMSQRSLFACAGALALVSPDIPASAQGDRQAAAEAYARVVDYPLLIEKAATQRAAGIRARGLHRIHYRGGGFRDDPFLRDHCDGRPLRGERAAGAGVLRRHAGRSIGAGQAACPRRRPHPIVERQTAGAERDFRER